MKAIVTSFLLAATMMLAPVMPTAAASTGGASTGIADFSAFAELVDYATYGTTAEYESAGCPAGTYKVRKHTRTKKKVVNSLIAGGVGAAVGGGLGGGRGALLGAGIGAGSYLTYRYVKDRRGRCVRRYL
jgi:hypothetical protein